MSPRSFGREWRADGREGVLQRVDVAGRVHRARVPPGLDRPQYAPTGNSDYLIEWPWKAMSSGQLGVYLRKGVAAQGCELVSISRGEGNVTCSGSQLLDFARRIR